MKIACLASAAAAALAVNVGAASAATILEPVSALSPLPVTPAATSIGSGFDNNRGSSTANTFIGDYGFTIGGNYDTTLSGNFYTGLSGSHISSVDLSLFQTGNSTALATTGTETVPTSPGTYSYFIDKILQPGVNYYLQADVTVPARDIGKFSVSAVASAVPEPSTWLLMFAGVAMIGGMLRYTRRQQGLALNAA